MISDYELIQFTEQWWANFTVYGAEEGGAYASHVFNHVDKRHFVNFLRDALVEFNNGES